MTDYKELARKMAEEMYPPELRHFQTQDGLLPYMSDREEEIDAYAAAMERLLPKMEKSREYLKGAHHLPGCTYGNFYTDGHVQRMNSKCSCGLEAHLSTLKSLLGQQ